MAKIKSDEMKSKQREKRRKCRTTTKLDEDLSGVLKKLKINGIGNAVKASVKKFLDGFDFENNKDNLMKKYLHLNINIFKIYYFKLEKRRKHRTTTKPDKDLSGVLKKLKINRIGNTVKASVKNFLH